MSVHVRENNGSGNGGLALGSGIESWPNSASHGPGPGQTCDSGACEMPSREALRAILDGLFAALFPTHLGLPDLTDEGIDYFVGHSLDATLRSSA